MDITVLNTKNILNQLYISLGLIGDFNAHITVRVPRELVEEAIKQIILNESLIFLTIHH